MYRSALSLSPLSLFPSLSLSLSLSLYESMHSYNSIVHYGCFYSEFWFSKVVYLYSLTTCVHVYQFPWGTDCHRHISPISIYICLSIIVYYKHSHFLPFVHCVGSTVILDAIYSPSLSFPFCLQKSIPLSHACFFCGEFGYPMLGFFLWWILVLKNCLSPSVCVSFSELYS